MTENANPEQTYAEKAARLQAENARLRAELERLQPSQRPLTVDNPPPAPAKEDAADTGDPMILGVSNWADQTTYLGSDGLSGALHVHGGAGRGVTAVGHVGPGVVGYSYDGDGVVGQAAPPKGGAGVRGRALGTGVHGESIDGGAGVYGHSSRGPGVYGYSEDSLGVVGASVNAVGTLAFSKEREGVNAASANADGVRASTLSASAAGVFAENASGRPTGVAVVGLGQAGIGVYASGAHAAVQLGRAATAGPPVDGFHVAGELMLDANADLYLYKSTGTPGAWKLIG